jgi:DNA-binding beta-propeller fold protein YncE
MPKGKTLWAGIIGIMILLASGGTLSAAVSYTSLPPITASLKAPEDVAIAPDGKIYIVDGYQDKIFIYDRKGASVGSLLTENPTSVAINTDGTIYIGSNYDLSVKILNPSGELTGSLGKGKDEFRLPRSITIDKTTGNVFVVDQLDESIKIYSSDGTYLRKITDLKNQPQDVALLNDELYVIDYPRMIDYAGGIMRGARIQVFSLDGNPLSDYRYDGTANKIETLLWAFSQRLLLLLKVLRGSGSMQEVRGQAAGGRLSGYTQGLTASITEASRPARRPTSLFMSQPGAGAGVYAEL